LVLSENLLPNDSRGEVPVDIQTVGLAGLGFLGRGIASCLLSHGFRVIAFTRRQSTHDAAREYIADAIGKLIARAGFPPSLAEQWPDRYIPVESCDRFGECDFVIETIIEDLDEKQKLFDKLEAVVRPDVPIASNTSAIPISQLQRGRRHPQRFLGMHWAEPAHVVRFMELIRGDETGDAAFEAATALGRAVGKEPSMVQKDVPGFIINRLGYAMYREALNVLEMGVADVETIDRSFRNAIGLFATMCGPLRWMDISGGPALYARAMKHVLPSLGNTTELPETLKKLADSGAQGITNGRGFYKYTAEEAKEWEELYLEHAWAVRALQDKYFPLNQNKSGA